MVQVQPYVRQHSAGRLLFSAQKGHAHHWRFNIGLSLPLFLYLSLSLPRSLSLCLVRSLATLLSPSLAHSFLLLSFSLSRSLFLVRSLAGTPSHPYSPWLYFLLSRLHSLSLSLFLPLSLSNPTHIRTHTHTHTHTFSLSLFLSCCLSILLSLRLLFSSALVMHILFLFLFLFLSFSLVFSFSLSLSLPLYPTLSHFLSLSPLRSLALPHSFSLLSLSLARVPCFSRACSPARALSLILPFSLLLSLSLCRCPILCFFGALPLSLPPFFFPSLAWLVENNTSKDTHSRASGEQYKEGDTQRLSLARA